MSKPGGNIPGSMGYGAYVHVVGKYDEKIHALVASSIAVEEGRPEKIVGASVVSRVVSRGDAETILRADGYFLCITPGTELAFVDPLKNLADVDADTAVQFAGKLDLDGKLYASKAKFFPRVPQKAKGLLSREAKPWEFSAPDYEHQTPGSIRIRMIAGKHKVPADKALQERVARVGLSVVPAYQRALAEDDPQKIPFRFYAFDDEDLSSEVCGTDGLILIPTQVIERLKNDDQLATLLADGVAFGLQDQWNRRVHFSRVGYSVDIAALAAGAFVPGASALAFQVGIANGKEMKQMQLQRARVALELMADAGYDVRQAPIVWQLLVPPPTVNDANPHPESYPAISEYVLSVLRRESYVAADGAIIASPPPAPTAPAANEKN